MSENNCIFCRIASGEIPTKFLYEDDRVLAFPDIRPVSPVHILIIPRKHYPTILDLPDELMPNISRAIRQLAKDQHLDSTGFRVVNNCGTDGGQEVMHVHFHLLGKRIHTWPPG
jgi:histidine triad (HIT) family protein